MWRLESTTTKSLFRHLHCRGSPLFKSRRGIDRNFVRNGGITRTHSSLCSWAGVSEQIADNVLSDFIFRKYKQDSAFRVSGVLQLAKTGPPVTKNFPLLRLFPSDAMMAWRFYTPYDVKRTNLHILTTRGMSHISSRIGQLWSSRKNSYALVQSPNSKITNQRIIDFNNSEWKSGRKFHFVGTLRRRSFPHPKTPKILISVHAQAKKVVKPQCEWKERHAVMLEMPFWVDWGYFGLYLPRKSPKCPKKYIYGKKLW